MRRLLLMLLAGTLFAGGEQMNERQFINIASGGTAGTYYPLAGGFAEIWNDNLENVNVSVQSTGASVANINLLREGKVEVVFVQNDIAYYAYNGEGAFEGAAYKGLRGLLSMYPETVQIIASPDIETVADLRGKRVAVGAPGSGTEANARQILAAAGMSFDDISPQYLSFGEAASNLRDRNIDAGFLTAGFPTSAVQDVSAQYNITLVTIERNVVERLMQQYPFYTEITVPAGTYKGVDEDVQTVAVKAILAVSADLDAQLVEKMLETAFANRDRLLVAHKKAENITQATALEGMSIPLHPGAEKFFGQSIDF